MLRVKDSEVFGSESFSYLSWYDKAATVWNNLDEVEKLGSSGIDMAATILLKASCVCRFIDIVPDEITGGSYGIVKKGHYPTCPAARIPCIEDLSIKQQLRKQRKEILCSHEGLLMVEEHSAKVIKRSRSTPEC